MKKAKAKRSYVCVICGKEDKSKKIKCCGKTMLSKKKGSWLE